MTVLAAVDELIERLERFEADAQTVVSAYVRLDAEARQRRLYLALVKARAKEIEQSIEAQELDRQAAAEVRRDLGRIVAWFGKPGNLANRPGVAVFACERLDLFEAVTLPRVYRTRLELGFRPLLVPLLGAQERLDSQLAVVVDRQRARFFLVGPDQTEELEGVQTPTRRGGRFRSDRSDAPGWGEKRYQRRMASQQHRHYAEVTEQASELFDRFGARGLAVMGPSVHAKALADFLPDRLQRALLGLGRLNPSTCTPADVAQDTWELHGEWERRDEERLVGEVVAGAAKGRAVNGIAETLRALGRGQVRTLVVPVAAQAAGFRCADSGRLVRGDHECRGEGAPVAVPNLIDAAIDDTLRQAGDVRVIDTPELAARIDGLGATLRFGD